MKNLRKYYPVICLMTLACSKGENRLTNPGASVISSSDDRDIAMELRIRYWDDASVLAVRQVNREGGPQNSEVELPQAQIQFYYDSLVQVYNAKRLAARDDVIKRYQIHAFESPRLRELLVAVADTTLWLTNWIYGNGQTGNPVADSLIAKYGLSVDRIMSGIDCSIWHFISIRPLNLIALGSRFMDIPCVQWATENQLGTLGGNPPDNIEATVYSDHTELEYRHGGWNYQIYWYFAVYPYGLVEFLATVRTPP